MKALLGAARGAATRRALGAFALLLLSAGSAPAATTTQNITVTVTHAPFLLVDTTTCLLVAANICLQVGAPPADPTIGLLSSDRDLYPNWKMAGLLSIGGEPRRTTQCGSAVTPIGSGSDDTTNIQTAINNCTAGQFVALAAGTFTIAEGHTVNVNKGITVRGVGAGQTIVQHPPGQDTTNDVCNAPGAWGATLNSDCPGNSPSSIFSLGGGGGSVGSGVALTADGQQGSASVTVASAAGISPGTLIQIDELATGQSMPDCCFNGGTGQVWAEPDYRVEWNQHSPAVNFFDSACNGFGGANNFSCGTNGDECAYSIRCGGVNEEMHIVTAVNSNVITFDSPLTLSYRVANTAQIRVISGAIQQAGLENLSVQYGDNGNVGFNYCIYCWATGVESTIWLNNGGFYFYKGAFRDQIDNFWVHNAAWPVNGGGGYAINLTFGASEELITNGISMLSNKVIVARASGAGTVISYNYMDDSYINGSQHSWVEIGINCSHLVGSHGCLFEGNQSANIDEDFTHGNTTHNVAFRNYVTGFRAPFTALDGTTIDDANNLPAGVGPLRALGDHGYGYWDSYIGNVVGTSGKVSAWNYRCAAGNADSGCSPALFNFGWNDTSVSGSLADGTMQISYPTSPTGANATITGAGCVSSGSNCTPVMDGNFDYKTNAIQWATNDTAHTLPASFYTTTAPAFFGSGTWPPVDPIHGTVASIPAHARWSACQPTPTAACIFGP